MNFPCINLSRLIIASVSRQGAISPGSLSLRCLSVTPTPAKSDSSLSDSSSSHGQSAAHPHRPAGLAHHKPRMINGYYNSIFDEVTPQLYDEWVRKGWLDKKGQPTWAWSMSTERKKVWQWWYQLDDGRPIWKKGPYDAWVNAVIWIIVIWAVLVSIHNIYWIITPPSKNPWIWKGKPEPMVGHGGHGDH